jgi:hypothetical protein
MTDSLGVPTGALATTTPATAPVVAGSPDLAHGLTQATNAAPELKTDPGTAVAVASGGGDVGLKARSVAQAKNHVATAEAASGMASGGLLGGIEHVVGAAGSDLASNARMLIGGASRLMNAPLRTVQQEYRYLHDVEALHGRTAAIEEGLGLIAGAAVGTAVDPGEGTILGADAAGWIEGHVAYKDSWQRAANPNYKDPHTGQLVSFGRDVADALGARTGGFHSALSGALDAMFDLGVDPGANAGKIYSSAYGIQGAGGLLGQVFSGTSTATAEDVARASFLPRIQHAFSDIAASDAGTIAVRYPGLAPIAKTLEADTTAAQVQQTFMELAGSMEMMEQPTLPTLSLGHYLGRTLRDAARNAGGPLGYLPRSIADAFESQPGNTLSTSSMDFLHGNISMTTDRGAKDLYRFFRFGMGDRVARASVDAWLHGAPGERYTMLKNGIYSTVLAMAKLAPKDIADFVAHPEAHEDLGNYMEEIGLPEIKDRVMETFANTMQAAMSDGGDPGKIYGLDEFGNVIKGPVMPDGGEIAAGITSGQTGNVSLPNLVEMRRMAQAVRSTKVTRVLARADDGLYNHFTQAIFKPLELMSGAYASHIALAEIIPNVLRDGVVATTKGMMARAAANMGYDASEQLDDPRAAAGWLWRLGGNRLLKDSGDAEALLKSRALVGGAKTPAGLQAGEITTGETQGVTRAENGLKQIGAVPGNHTNDWAQFQEGDKRFAELHQQSFRRAAVDRWSREAAGAYLQAAREGATPAEGTIAARTAVADALRDEPPEVLENFARNFGKRASAPGGWDNVTDWADAIVSRMKGVIHGASDLKNKVAGPINMDLLHSLANGHTPDLDYFDNLEAAQRPLRVEGQIILPSGSKLVNKIATAGFKVINPMVDAISRNQEYAVEYLKQYHDLQKAVDNGTITDDERVVMSAYRSVQHGVKYVHNLTDRTQWTTTLRNWAPFFFAQEQAYRRMGRFLVEDPGGFRRYQMAISAVTNLANTYADGQGNQYVTFPGSGFFGKGVAQAMGLHGLMVGTVPPAQFGGSLSSASVVFPMSNGVAPELGPIGSIGAQSLTSMFEHLSKEPAFASFAPVSNVAISALNAVDGNAGSYNESILEQLVPNETLLRGIQLYEAAKLNGGGGQEGFNSAILQTYNMLMYMQNEATAQWEKDGEKGPAPQIVPSQQDALSNPRVMQQFAQRVKNTVVGYYVTRAILGFFSPVSADVEPQNYGFSAELQAAITKAGSVTKGFDNFLAANPNALPYTVAESFTPNGQGQPSGLSLSSTAPAQQWIVDHQALVDKNPAALWLMPQLKDAKYSATVYNEQIADGLRVRETPEQHLDQLYIAAGNAIYYKNLDVFEKQLDSVGNNSTAKNSLYNRWDSFVTQLGKQYPIWYEDFKSPDKYTNATQTVANLQQIFKDNEAPTGVQTEGVHALLKGFDVASTEYSQAGAGQSYSSQQYAQSQVYDAWVNYLQATASEYPNLKPIIQTVFMHALKAPA